MKGRSGSFRWNGTVSAQKFELKGGTLLAVFLNSALSENSKEGAILRGFFHTANRDEFNISHGQPLDLQQQVSQVLVAAAAID